VTSGEDALHKSRALNFSYVLFLDLTCNVDVCEILEKFVNSGGPETIAILGGVTNFACWEFNLSSVTR